MSYDQCEVIAITGEARCGKTLTLSICVHDDVVNGYPAHLNYTHKEATVIRNQDEFKAIRKGVIGLDEAYLEADSKRGMSGRNIIWSQIVWQRSKMGVARFYYTLPAHLEDIDIIDKRFRVATNTEMQPQYFAEYDLLIVKVIQPPIKGTVSWVYVEDATKGSYDGIKEHTYGSLFDTYELHQIGEITRGKNE